MTVLGIDPGLRHLACAVLEDGSQGPRWVEGYRVRLEGDFGRRAEAVARLVEEWLSRHTPDGVACESVFLHGRSTTVHLVSHVTGLIHAQALRYGVPFLLVSPSEVKRALVWGRASKEQVARAVQALVRDVPRALYGGRGARVQVGDHLYDAAAVALVGARRLRGPVAGEVPIRVAVYRSHPPVAVGS